MEDFVAKDGPKEAEPLFLFEAGEEGMAKQLVNQTEYVGKKLTTDQRVPGRIGRQEFFNFWKEELGASDFVLSVLKSGYSFPFKTLPPSSMARNNR